MSCPSKKIKGFVCRMVTPEPHKTREYDGFNWIAKVPTPCSSSNTVVPNTETLESGCVEPFKEV